MKPTNIRLKSYTDGILKCYGITSLQVVHYKIKKLKKFAFFLMQSRNEITPDHLASDRLSLIKMMNHSKTKEWVELSEGLVSMLPRLINGPS